MFLKRNLPAIAWALIIFVLISLPPQAIDDLPFLFKGFDKIVHAGMFFILLVLLFFGFKTQYTFEKLRSHYIISSLIVSFFWAILTELMQLIFFTYRSFELLDIFFDFIGIGIGFVVFIVMEPKIKPIKNKGL